MALGKVVMVQGTASDVGKTVIAAGLCRALHRRGLRVAPFKAQNMALNSAATPDGREIGRAQAVQADACGLAPRVEMNPVLLKPDSDVGAQVVVLGKPIGRMTADEYHQAKPELMGTVLDCLTTLREETDIVVIEGAGSPAEVNLRDRDIVNMAVALAVKAPVLLAADIDRGGALAAVVGTLALIAPEERELVAGTIINRFRGDLSLLQPALEFLEQRTERPVLGVVPFIKDLRIADEDSLGIDRRQPRHPKEHDLDIAVVRFPRISNYDDVAPFERTPGVVVRFVERVEDVGTPDLLIVPGTKNTMRDLEWLRQRGFETVVRARAAAGAPVLGICGGCQMLGGIIRDPALVESSLPDVPGLGLLDLDTNYEPTKRTEPVTGTAVCDSFFTRADVPLPLSGYVIHMGRVTPDAPLHARGCVAGTMFHGLFEAADARDALLGALRARRGLPALTPNAHPVDEYDRLARVIESSCDVERILRIAGVA